MTQGGGGGGGGGGGAELADGATYCIVGGEGIWQTSEVCMRGGGGGGRSSSKRESSCKSISAN